MAGVNRGSGAYFVYLKESKLTLNLTDISVVLWGQITDSQIGLPYITTVRLGAAGDFFITQAESELLSKLLTAFNQSHQTAVNALANLEEIADALFWLANPANPHGTDAASNQAVLEHGYETPPFSSDATNLANQTGTPKISVESSGFYPLNSEVTPNTSHKPVGISGQKEHKYSPAIN